jgi:hypothetical protein
VWALSQYVWVLHLLLVTRTDPPLSLYFHCFTLFFSSVNNSLWIFSSQSRNVFTSLFSSLLLIFPIQFERNSTQPPLQSNWIHLTFTSSFFAFLLYFESWVHFNWHSIIQLDTLL